MTMKKVSRSLASNACELEALRRGGMERWDAAPALVAEFAGGMDCTGRGRRTTRPSRELLKALARSGRAMALKDARP